MNSNVVNKTTEMLIMRHFEKRGLGIYAQRSEGKKKPKPPKADISERD